jgi:hypothetical protein
MAANATTRNEQTRKYFVEKGGQLTLFEVKGRVVNVLDEVVVVRLAVGIRLHSITGKVSSQTTITRVFVRTLAVFCRREPPRRSLAGACASIHT